MSRGRPALRAGLTPAALIPTGSATTSWPPRSPSCTGNKPAWPPCPPDSWQRPTVAGYETFAGRICELADGTVVSPGTVAGLLDEAVIERIVFDGPSRVINVGRQRRFTGALRRAIEARDRFCTGPGCDVPAADSEIDHLQPHSHSGPTDQINGDPKCHFHHPLRHHQEAEDAKTPPTRPRTTRWWQTPQPRKYAQPPDRWPGREK